MSSANQKPKNQRTASQKPANNRPINQNSRRQLSPREKERLIEKRKRKLLRRRRFRIFLLLFLVLAFVAGAVLAFRALFKITGYKVEGNKTYSDARVFENSGLKLQRNLFFSDINTAEKVLTQKLPYIGSVEIKRSLPGTLLFEVTETKAVCVYQSGSNLLYLDKNGKVLALKTGKKPDKLALLRCPTIGKGQAGYTLEFAKADEFNTNFSKIYSYLTDKAGRNQYKGINSSNVSQPKSVKDGYSIEFKNTTDKNIESLYEDLAASVNDGRIKDVYYLSISSPVKADKGYVINFTKKVITDPLPVYKNLIASVDKSGIKDITGINIQDPDNVTLVYQNRIILKIGTPSELERRLELAAKVLEKENSISPSQEGAIDLTIEGKAYWQPAQKD